MRSSEYGRDRRFEHGAETRHHDLTGFLISLLLITSFLGLPYPYSKQSDFIMTIVMYLMHVKNPNLPVQMPNALGYAFLDSTQYIIIYTVYMNRGDSSPSSSISSSVMFSTFASSLPSRLALFRWPRYHDMKPYIKVARSAIASVTEWPVVYVGDSESLYS